MQVAGLRAHEKNRLDLLVQIAVLAVVWSKAGDKVVEIRSEIYASAGGCAGDEHTISRPGCARAKISTHGER